MKYKLKIHCTKEHLQQSIMCGTFGNIGDIGNNCWIAKAVQKVFPNCYVGNEGRENKIMFFKNIFQGKQCEIALPKIALNKIKEFDNLSEFPEERLKLKPFSFKVEFDQQTFDTILQSNGFSCQQFKDKVLSSGNLELIEN